MSPVKRKVIISPSSGSEDQSPTKKFTEKHLEKMRGAGEGKVGREGRQKKSKILYLSSGSTLLNLSCTDKANGAFKTGTLNNIVGDSQSGKSLLAMSIMAEACASPSFKDYRLIYDDAEAALFFDIENLFGERLAERIEFPKGVTESGEATCSSSVEDFEITINNLLKEKTPFIYILDSLDSLNSIYDIEYMKEKRTAIEKGKPLPGSYGMNKAKALSDMFKAHCKALSSTKSIIIILSQIRDNPNQIGYVKEPYRAGGRALKFYSTHEIWMNVKNGLLKQVRGQKHRIGQIVTAKTKKNKVTGKVRAVDFPIYYSYGIDDIESNLAFLSMYNEAKTDKQSVKVNIDGQELTGTLQKVIKDIEEEGLIIPLRKKVYEVWKEVEGALITERKPKYL